MEGRRKRLTEEMIKQAQERIGDVKFETIEEAIIEARICIKQNEKLFPSVWKYSEGENYIVVKTEDREFAQDLGYEEVITCFQIMEL